MGNPVEYIGFDWDLYDFYWLPWPLTSFEHVFNCYFCHCFNAGPLKHWILNIGNYRCYRPKGHGSWVFFPFRFCCVFNCIFDRNEISALHRPQVRIILESNQNLRVDGWMGDLSQIICLFFLTSSDFLSFFLAYSSFSLAYFSVSLSLIVVSLPTHPFWCHNRIYFSLHHSSLVVFGTHR